MRWDYVFVDPATDRLYVAHRERVDASIPSPGTPECAVVDGRGHSLTAGSRADVRFQVGCVLAR